MTNKGIHKMDLNELREEFKKDKFASCRLGAVIDEAESERVVCSMDILPHHLNGVGRVMGGAVFTLADFSAAVLSFAMNKKTVSLSSNINFLGAPKGKRLITESKCVKDGNSVCVYETTVKDELGSKVAFVTATGFVIK